MTYLVYDIKRDKCFMPIKEKARLRIKSLFKKLNIKDYKLIKKYGKRF